VVDRECRGMFDVLYVLTAASAGTQQLGGVATLTYHSCHLHCIESVTRHQTPLLTS
jgi:hypothetical protein